MKIQASDLQQTIKRGIGLYIVLALIALPSGICSHQHSIPDYQIPAIDQPAWHVEQSAWYVEPFIMAAVEQTMVEAPAPVAIAEPESENPLPFHDHIMQASRTYDVAPELIRAIIAAESNYNPRAVSKRGAQGLMQLMPITARSLGIKDCFDPALNIDAGVRYFRQMLDRFNGDEFMALAAYNAGSRYVRQYKGVPPFQATRSYIKKVMKYREEFESKPVSQVLIGSAW